jgi:hypothetical protein
VPVALQAGLSFKKEAEFTDALLIAASRVKLARSNVPGMANASVIAPNVVVRINPSSAEDRIKLRVS